MLGARKNFYEFLSEVYARGVPRKFIEDIKKGAFTVPRTRNNDIERGFREINSCVEKAESVEELMRDIEDEYVRLFLGPGKSKIMPYQSTYEGDPVYGETTLRIKKIYLQAGLRIPPESGISEDHLGSELQFIAHLCGIAMDLLEQGKDAAPILRLQREFIEENMDWVQRFCEDVQQTPAANFYRGLAMVTRGFLEEDRALIHRLIAQL